MIDLHDLLERELKTLAFRTLDPRYILSVKVIMYNGDWYELESDQLEDHTFPPYCVKRYSVDRVLLTRDWFYLHEYLMNEACAAGADWR